MSVEQRIALKVGRCRGMRPPGEKKVSLEGWRQTCMKESWGAWPSGDKKSCSDGRLMGGRRTFVARNETFSGELSIHLLIYIYRMTVRHNFYVAKLNFLGFLDSDIQRKSCCILKFHSRGRDASISSWNMLRRWQDGENTMDTLHTLSSYFSVRMEKERISLNRWKEQACT